MFHVKDGWYFTRREDGTVRVISPDPKVDLVMDPDTWCSVIAHCSARGDTAEAFQEAQEFHSKQA